MCDPFEMDREDFAVGERFVDRESTEEEALEAIELGAEEEAQQTPDPALAAVLDYLAAVKECGKAFTQLGRPCDKEAA